MIRLLLPILEIYNPLANIILEFVDKITTIDNIRTSVLQIDDNIPSIDNYLSNAITQFVSEDNSEN